MAKQLPFHLHASRGDELRSQYGALCYRKEGGKVQILLITSRGTGRWVIPKGWPIEGLSPADSAGVEAWEEAGVTGEAIPHCLGIYTYTKWTPAMVGLPCAVMVYPLPVRSLSANFPEKGQRRQKWFTPKKAAARVAEPELARILRSFDPRGLRTSAT